MYTQHICISWYSTKYKPKSTHGHHKSSISGNERIPTSLSIHIPTVTVAYPPSPGSLSSFPPSSILISIPESVVVDRKQVSFVVVDLDPSKARRGRERETCAQQAKRGWKTSSHRARYLASKQIGEAGASLLVLWFYRFLAIFVEIWVIASLVEMLRVSPKATPFF